MASKLSVFDWHCSEQNLQPGGHGGEDGCIGLVKWKKYVVWRGSNDVMEMFTVSEGRLKRYADGEGVGKATLVAHGDKLLAVGGFEQGVHTTKVKRFTVNNEMKIHMCGSDIPDMPVGCGQSCAISDGDNLVVMGGYDSSGSMLDKVQVYSNKTRTWSTGWALPSPCAGGSATLQYGTIILLGGNHITTSVWYAKISDLLVSHFVSFHYSLLAGIFYLYDTAGRMCVGRVHVRVYLGGHVCGRECMGAVYDSTHCTHCMLCTYVLWFE